jgi:hypothetical protein
MTESFQEARRAALQGIVKAAHLLAKRSVEDGEPLEDVAVLLDTVLLVLEDKSP